jgi:hypothetical protein
MVVVVVTAVPGTQHSGKGEDPFPIVEVCGSVKLAQTWFSYFLCYAYVEYWYIHFCLLLHPC